MDDRFGEAGESALGASGDHDEARADVDGLARQVQRDGGFARGRQDEKHIAGLDRGSGGLAHEYRRQAEVHQAHRDHAPDQPGAALASHEPAAGRPLQHCDQALDLRGIDVGEGLRQLSLDTVDRLHRSHLLLGGQVGFGEQPAPDDDIARPSVQNVIEVGLGDTAVDSLR